MIETRGRVTISTVEPPLGADRPITLRITAPASEWKKVVSDLGRYGSGSEHVGPAFYSALEAVVDTL